MLLKDLLCGVDIIDCTADLNADIVYVTSNSKKAVDKSLFVAIKGVKADGHEYAKSAVENGAFVVLCEHDCGVENYIKVKDARYAYSIIASNYYQNPSKDLKIIGVTGTNGKTSTTYIMKDVLESLGNKVGLIGTIQNIVGERVIEATQTTPDAMELHGLFREMVKSDCKYCVMEVSSHALDQHRCAGIEFECSIFTNLSQDHLDYHGTMEEYLAVKAKLFTQSKHCILNYDDAATESITKISTGKNMTYSALKDEADVVAKNVKLNGNGVEYQALIIGTISRVSFGIPGMFSVYNSLGVITACLALGFELPDVATAIKSAKGVKGRMEIVQVDTDYTVVIDYAHTPDSLVKIGETLKTFAKGNIITVFGCGGDRDRTKRPLMAKAAESFSDYFILTSDNPRTEDPQRIVDDAYEGVKKTKKSHKIILNRKEAIEFALKKAKKDDIVLIAGKGHETYQVLACGKIDFDERCIVREILGK